MRAEDLTRETGTSFGSVLGTMAHILGSEQLWLSRFLGHSAWARPEPRRLSDARDAQRRPTRTSGRRSSSSSPPWPKSSSIRSSPGRTSPARPTRAAFPAGPAAFREPRDLSPRAGRQPAAAAGLHPTAHRPGLFPGCVLRRPRFGGAGALLVGLVCVACPGPKAETRSSRLLDPGWVPEVTWPAGIVLPESGLRAGDDLATFDPAGPAYIARVRLGEVFTREERLALVAPPGSSFRYSLHRSARWAAAVRPRSPGHRGEGGRGRDAGPPQERPRDGGGAVRAQGGRRGSRPLARRGDRSLRLGRQGGHAGVRRGASRAGAPVGLFGAWSSPYLVVPPADGSRGAESAATARVSAGARSAAGRARRPNIVWISLDTLRADHLGAYGYERPTSPNLDAFAARGLRFHGRSARRPGPARRTVRCSPASIRRRAGARLADDRRGALPCRLSDLRRHRRRAGRFDAGFRSRLRDLPRRRLDPRAQPGSSSGPATRRRRRTPLLPVPALLRDPRALYPHPLRRGDAFGAADGRVLQGDLEPSAQALLGRGDALRRSALRRRHRLHRRPGSESSSPSSSGRVCSRIRSSS